MGGVDRHRRARVAAETNADRYHQTQRDILENIVNVTVNAVLMINETQMMLLFWRASSSKLSLSAWTSYCTVCQRDCMWPRVNGHRRPRTLSRIPVLYRDQRNRAKRHYGLNAFYQSFICVTRSND